MRCASERIGYQCAMCSVQLRSRSRSKATYHEGHGEHEGKN